MYPGEDSHMEQTGMLVGNFEGDHLGVAQAFRDPQNETNPGVV